MLLDTVKITESKRADPTAYLEGMGFTVRKEGRHLSVRSGQDERYRITQKPDGHWVTCDQRGHGIGDNLALVRDLEPALGFLDAVSRLTAGPVVDRVPVPAAPRRERPALLPQTRADRHAGRGYLHGRGVSSDTLDHAERTGFLRYTGGVLFVGRDVNGQARHITKRAIDPGPDEKPKRDLAGSDKQYPPLLPGNPRVVWIVEGGVDALAARDLAQRRGKAPPTVLVSGGATVRCFLDHPTVQTLLLHADAVVVVRDNESTAKKQAETDSAHDLQIVRIRELRSTCGDWRPPAGVKDVAELNQRERAGAGARRSGPALSSPATNQGRPRILCRNRNNLVAEYALRDLGKPIGIARYALAGTLPAALKASLPTVEEVEAERGKAAWESRDEEATAGLQNKKFR